MEDDLLQCDNQIMEDVGCTSFVSMKNKSENRADWRTGRGSIILEQEEEIVCTIFRLLKVTYKNDYDIELQKEKENFDSRSFDEPLEGLLRLMKF